MQENDPWKVEKIKLSDLEIGDAIWVDEFDDFQIIIKLNYPINGKTAITFENEETLEFDNRRKFTEL